MYKLFVVRILILIIVLSSASRLHAGRYYELNTGIFSEQEDSPPHTTHVRLLTPVIPSIERVTESFIERDSIIRGILFPRSDVENNIELTEENSTNIFQMAIYGLDEDNQSYILKDDYYFYLSGTVPIQGGRNPVINEGIINISSRDIYLNDKVIPTKIIQRHQPIIDSALITTTHLLRINEFISEDNEEIRDLKSKAQEKQEKILEFRSLNNENVIAEATTNISASFETSVRKSLNLGDYKFCLTEAEMPAITLKIINSIKESIFNNFQNSNALLTSPHFNLSCSEQLVLKTYANAAAIDSLAVDISQNIPDNKNLKSIIIHMHSTKTPCFTCLINFCAHCQEDGVISTLFRSIKESLPSNELSLRFLVSYHASHRNREISSMYVPTVNEYLHIDEDKVGIMDGRHLIKNEEKIIIPQSVDFLNEEGEEYFGDFFG
ncbi:MAG: hypothetical protein KBC28_08095 [Alphaproteobacteria bacterium]|nr:hypothetical protein [Alphaproteobacteria bacterium]